MSFAFDIKTEILKNELPPCCRTAQGAALLLFGRVCSDRRLSLRTEHSGAAEAYAAAVRLFTGVEPPVEETANGAFRVDVRDRLLTDAAAAELGLAPGEPRRPFPAAVIAKRCCRTAFLGGAFLAAGTVTDPEKDYHLEFSCPEGLDPAELSSLLTEFEYTPGTAERGAQRLVYLKNSEQIEDLLGRMGAAEGMMAFIQAKMRKDIRNAVNRKVNFERANIGRSMAASNRQYEAICRIRDAVGLEALPDDLRVVAEARLEHREAGVSELSRLLPVPLTVSGLYHRFQRIIKLSEEL